MDAFQFSQQNVESGTAFCGNTSEKKIINLESRFYFP